MMITHRQMISCFTRTISLCAAIVLGLTANAQQAPYYTNFMFNKLPYNPGYAGSKDAICATILYHEQWQGYTADGAPSTLFANIHAPVGKKHGIGLGIVNDKIGYENTLTLHAYYNYKFDVGSNGKLAVGPSLGMMQKTLDGSKLHSENPNDPHVPLQSVSTIQPDLGFGLYYTNTSLYNAFAGLSANNVLEQKLTYDAPGGSIDYAIKRTYYAMTGISYDLSPSLALNPTLLYKTDMTKGQLDLNADVVYNNKIRGGLTYRTSDAVSVLIGYKFTDNFHIGYSYDITTSKLNTVSNGTHEFVLNYCFRIKTKPKPEKRGIRLSPRYM